MQYYKLEAIVLKKRELKENDLVLTVYSKQKGKLDLVLRGGKKITSKMAGHVEPMSWVELNVVTAKGDRDLIIGAQLKKSYQGITKDVNKLGYVSYFLEVVDAMTREENGDERIFDLLTRAMDRVLNTRTVKDLSLIRVLFVFKLLYLLGFNPEEGDQKINKLIESLVRGKVDEVMVNEEFRLNRKKLFEVSQDSLKAQLDKPMNSEKFIKEVV